MYDCNGWLMSKLRPPPLEGQSLEVGQTIGPETTNLKDSNVYKVHEAPAMHWGAEMLDLLKVSVQWLLDDIYHTIDPSHLHTHS